ncbi:cadherin-like beta sandwich domain-containing protein [uncultured Clostridium sp.]|uniref:N-acetylmuramoyl-L-alanine amidase family protein n=1 Tax=uncultured Clostridium sp. TaxID=59620 RepID=UPI0028EE3E51|nr:cadherin-like beta sandwich domain-containing protein [uncultured Clostridium sp.]
MNKNIKRIIALVLTINAFSTISAITPIKFGNIMAKPVYASSYSPDSDELKTLKVKSTNGDTLDLRDGYNGDTVKLSDDREYYVKLTDDSDGIKIDAEPEGEDEIVRIFTSDKADAQEYKSGDKISLGKGDTTVYVRTYNSLDDYRKAKNDDKDVTKCEQEYTIDVRKTQASDAEDDAQDSIYLDNIKLSKGDISFLKQKTSYDVSVDSSVSEIKITAPPEDDSDRVRIDGDVVDSNDNYKKNVSLDQGTNTIKIKVTDDKDNQRTYTLNVTRGDASDTRADVYLDKLKLDHGDINFSEDEDDYTVDLDEAISKLTVNAEPEDEDYLVTINGDEVNSDDDYEKEISLSKGKNTITIVVEDELNDKKRTYTLTANRGTSQDSTNTSNGNNSGGNTSTGNTSTDATKKSQWVQTDKGWEYYDENGSKVTGWLQKNDKWYLLDGNGIMLTGWQCPGGKWYMLDKTNGDMKVGWYKEEAVNTSDSNSDASNTAASNIKTEKWYYLNSDGSMQTGWLVYSNSKYYFSPSGVMLTGTQTIDGKEYKFNDSGVLII